MKTVVSVGATFLTRLYTVCICGVRPTISTRPFSSKSWPVLLVCLLLFYPGVQRRPPPDDIPETIFVEELAGFDGQPVVEFIFDELQLPPQLANIEGLLHEIGDAGAQRGDRALHPRVARDDQHLGRAGERELPDELYSVAVGQ